MGQKAPNQGTRTQMKVSLCCSSYHPNCPKGRRYRVHCNHVHPAASAEQEDTKKRMESISAPVQPPEAKASKAPTGPGQLGWALLWMTQLLCSGVASVNPHQPVKITWKLQNGLTREVLNSTTAIHPPNTWWPDLYFDLKPMVNVPWARGYLREQGFWACPGAPRRTQACLEDLWGGTRLLL